MGIDDLDKYKALVASGQKLFLSRRTLADSSNSGALISQWQNTPDPGTVATSAETYTNTTVGAVGQPDPVGSYYLVSASFALHDSQAGGGSGAALVLIDRLVTVGGLVGNVITAQTVNTPSLPRYTTGAGVWAMVEGFGNSGSAGNVTMSYTNQAGTASRTSKAIGFTAGQNSARIIPLQATDTGVRSVQSATLTASTGTAGNWGITLFRPITFLPLAAGYENYERTVLNGGIGGGLSPILAGACLSFISRMHATTNLTGPTLITLNLADA